MIKNKISIVTISYNQSKFLEECINSVIKQDYDNIEYIVVDGGSIDNSRQIINNYRDKLKIIYQTTNTGPADALNIGFNQASGDIYGYINSDDFFLKNSLKVVNDYFNKFPSYDVIYGNGVIIDKNSYFTKKMISTDLNWNRFKYDRLLICQQSTFFKKDVYKKINGFNKNNNRSWDFEFILDALKAKCKIKHVDYTFGAFRIYPESITGNKNKDLSKKIHKKIFFKYFGRNKDPIEKLISKIFYFFDKLLNPFAYIKKIFDIIYSYKKIKIE